MIRKLYSLLTLKDKKLLILLFFMTIIMSIIETAGIAIIMPFISMASNPLLVESNQYLHHIYVLFDFESTKSFIMFFGFALILLYVIRGIYSFFYTYMLNYFSFSRYHYFAYKLFQNYVGLPYNEFVKRNSSIMSKAIITEASNLTQLIQQVLLLCSEFFIVLFLYAMMIAVNYKMTIILTCVLGLKVILLSKKLTKVMKKQGNIRSEQQDKFYKIINETFGNFKMIKLLSNEKLIFNQFSNASNSYSKANIIASSLSQLPKNVLEAIGLSALIASVIYILYRYDDTSLIIPIISMYALALYRILPALNRIITSYNSIAFLSKSLDIVIHELSYPIEIENNEEITFHNKIKLNNVSFSYNDKKTILEDITLTIRKGDKIAFIGESGSGKSTLVDLIIGIYKPKNGIIYIDNQQLTSNNIRSWRKKIGYIPQSIYLFDGTIAENIAFGHEYNEEKVSDILKKVNMSSFLKQNEGIQTRVGENGIQLSGGQKQRIGIARALYGDPEILVLDEATSALDNETEAKIMEEIYQLCSDKTLIVIAHRLSTIEKCTSIIDINLLTKKI